MPEFVVDAHGNRHWPAGSGGRGRFAPKDAKTPKGAGRGPRKKAPPPPAAASWADVRGRLAAASVDDLLGAFATLSRAHAGAARDRALEELDAELARREAKALAVDDDHQ